MQYKRRKNELIFLKNILTQLMGYLFALLTILYVNAEKEIRIDWVGETGHAQPQDPLTTTKPNKLRPVSETRQALNVIPIDDDDDDDLQQKVEPIFGKGTYLEFDEQRKLKP